MEFEIKSIDFRSRETKISLEIERGTKYQCTKKPNYVIYSK